MFRLITRVLIFTAVSLALFIGVSGQVREITAKEFADAWSSGQAAVYATYPRIEVYTFKSDEPRDVWFRRTVESSKRQHTLRKRSTRNGIEHTEDIEYDGKFYTRTVDGVWQRPDASDGATLAGSRDSGVKTYTVEEFSQYGKTEKLYTETWKIRDRTHYTSWFRIDNLGRIVEYEDKEDDLRRHMMYEYPKTVTPIKKPKLGSKEDVK